METKVNYAVVGLFVVILGAMLVVGGLWLVSGKRYGQVYEPYMVYTTESVSGLNVNAPVKYHGVSVGLVERIGLDRQDPQRVYLLLDLDRGTPVKTDTVASLRTQGLTGLAYVELSGGTAAAPMLRPKPGQPYPVIRSVPSVFATLEQSVRGLLAAVNVAVGDINTVLGPQNRQALKSSLHDLAIVAHALAQHTGDIDSSLSNGAQTLRNTARMSRELPQLVSRIGQAADQVNRMAVRVSNAAAATHGAARNLNQTLPEVGRALVNIQQLSDSLRRLSDELQRNPNALLLGAPRRPLGPGE
ncbi:MAG: MlaD family protein [Betaproteobacteria bacterium]|nr:MlaD family protein [Betaproteobacteria bacterium]